MDLLAKVCLRAWGIDDPRVLPHLRAENQPGRTRRSRAVGKRARAAGWPLPPNIEERRKAGVAAARRLERMDFSHRGQSRRSWRQRVAAAAYESRRSQVDAYLDEQADWPPVEPSDWS